MRKNKYIICCNFEKKITFAASSRHCRAHKSTKVLNSKTGNNDDERILTKKIPQASDTNDCAEGF